MTPLIVDKQQRQDAIDPSRSFIVQAPAGSGKTELIIQRFLALLATVKGPQQILAITFTRKAASEMRSRIIEALDAAEKERPDEAHKQTTWDLARKALERDLALGWNIRQNPNILAIQTIDSFNAELVRKMPWLTRFGGLPEMSEDPDRLYLIATENLLGRLGTEQDGADELAKLLAHLDNRVARLQEMLVQMLQRRDQWLRHLAGIHSATPRTTLEAGLAGVGGEVLSELHSAFPQNLDQTLMACANHAVSNLPGDTRPMMILEGRKNLPGTGSDDLVVWQGIADFLLTAGGDLRKPGGINKGLGFPAGKEGAEAKTRMQALLEELARHPKCIDLLARCRALPGATYSDAQWDVLQALVSLLPILVTELWKVFRFEGQADFSEIAMKALASLGDEEDPSDLLLKLDNCVDHILVDEFQDTNWLQYRLLKTLTAGWQQGDGRSLFLVGDPMQSIYLFREAEVGLFLHVFAGLFGEAPKLIPLQLQTNFRSQKGVVEWVNRVFATIFPAQTDEATGAVPLAEAVARHEALPGPACCLHPMVGRDDEAEAKAVVELIAKEQAENPGEKIALLVRYRTHLPAILQRLREKGIPYQAQDIDLLGEQPEVLDILSLTRALTHRADRLSWLSVLRAPWCGLLLSDLHALVDDAPKENIPTLLEDPARWERLSQDGVNRLAHAWPILQKNLERRSRVPLRELVEGCWLALGGPACYDPEGVENARKVFDLLDCLQKGGEMPDLEGFKDRLAKLYASPQANDGHLQIMTIHKAKGLEFDTVIIPGLGRMPKRDDPPLLRWIEHPRHGLLLAPIAPRDGSDQDPIYKFIGKMTDEKANFEVARLLYVATTRAKKKIHLFGHARQNSKGELKADAGSLLDILWPVVQEEFTLNAVAPEEVTTRREIVVSRLPDNWATPELFTAPLPALPATARAVGGLEADMQTPLWHNQARRHIGTLVHRLLERIGRMGVDWWQGQNEDFLRQMIGRQLGALGMPLTEQPDAINEVLDAVGKTVNSQTGRWLLDNTKRGAFELALSGVIDGVVAHTVIDRAFFEGENIVWIVDYKTSKPGQGEILDEFLRLEADRHREQLNIYRELISNNFDGCTIKSGLYFPMIDAWQEVA